MTRRWKIFQGVPNKYRNDNPHVTLNKKGVILMNIIAYERMGSPEAVELRYDPANSLIGLKPTEPDADNAFPVKPKDNFRTRIVHASPFSRHHEIGPDRTVAFLGPEFDSDRTLVLDRTATTVIGRTGKSER